MAPEQFVDARHAGVTADVYSLAIIAFQLLTGRLPFGSRKEGKSLYELITAHVNQPVPELSNLSSDLSAGLHSVFEKALAKNPAERYQSANEFIVAFHSVIEEQPTEALLLSQKEVPAQFLVGTLDLAVPVQSQALSSSVRADPSVTTP
jgi:serine/threonine-protein kinase